MKDVFFFIGPEKTGTTTIFEILPFLKSGVQKELFNLSRRCDVEAELKRISSAPESQCYIVEPTYFTSQYAMNCISRLQEKYNVIVVHTRRDPLERSISHYLHHKLKGRVSSVASAVKRYPEIVVASNYSLYETQWRTKVNNFIVMNVIGNENLKSSLEEIGVVSIEDEQKVANPRLAPKNIFLSRLGTICWDFLLCLRLNKLVPEALKLFVKQRVYYGGVKVDVSEKEKEDLSACLSSIR